MSGIELADLKSVVLPRITVGKVSVPFGKASELSPVPFYQCPFRRYSQSRAP
jgi:hypothetical protein